MQRAQFKGLLLCSCWAQEQSDTTSSIAAVSDFAIKAAQLFEVLVWIAVGSIHSQSLGVASTMVVTISCLCSCQHHCCQCHQYSISTPFGNLS
jgi:hypothetical protein